MNRRTRNRTYGGARVRRGKPRPLLDRTDELSDFILECLSRRSDRLPGLCDGTYYPPVFRIGFRGFASSACYDGNLSNFVLPVGRTGFMNRFAASIDGDGYRHVGQVEFVDGFHAEILESDDLGGFDRF